MELIYPSYYHDFRCIAGACPDSCCHQWQVQVDEAAARYYRSLPGPLGEDLRSAMVTEEGGVFLQNVADRCPMWREDGLCRIQAELGEQALCHVCREFPRLRQDYGDFVELGLEMSCPEAARIMLTCNRWTLVSRMQDGGDEPDYDSELMDLLRATRPYALQLLADQCRPVQHRLAVLLMYGYHVQAAIDGGELTAFDPEAALSEAMSFAGKPEFEKLVDFYSGLELLTRDWQALLAHPCTAPWDEMLCKLAAYGIYRYWYQAVADWDLAARVKLVLLHCILSRRFGGRDLPRAIQLYSKEIENSIDNTEALLDAAYSHEALTDAGLLALLLED